MQTVVKIIKTLLFGIVLMVALYFIYVLFGLLSLWFFKLNIFWAVVVFFVFEGFIFGIFNILAAFIMAGVSKIAGYKKIAFAIVVIATLYLSFTLIYSSWTAPFEYSNIMKAKTIMYNLFIISLTFALIAGSATSIDD